jgi:hypothetical protein
VTTERREELEAMESALRSLILPMDDELSTAYNNGVNDLAQRWSDALAASRPSPAERDREPVGVEVSTCEGCVAGMDHECKVEGGYRAAYLDRIKREIGNLDAAHKKHGVGSVGGWYALTGNGYIVAQIQEEDLVALVYPEGGSR